MRKCLPLILSFSFLGVITFNFNNLHSQSTWHTYQKVNQVQIDYSDPVSCSFSQGNEQAEYIFLKISNLTNKEASVSFRLDWYSIGSVCSTCANDEYKYTFKIPANGVISADCNFPKTGMSKLAVFKKFVGRPNRIEFEKFEITNIIVE